MKKAGKRRGRKKKTIFYVVSSLAAAFVVSASAVWFLFLLTEVPDISTFDKREVAESTKIFDHTGEVLLWEVFGDERRTVVPFDRISIQLKNATVAIEDSSFYAHNGFSPLAIARAFIADIFKGKRQGGSTITQQLVKNTLLTPERTIARKIKEAVAAIKLESVYSKDEILDLYLNEIPYGSNIYGVEAASNAYFGKSADGLDLAESAYLAALPQAPSYFSPYGNHTDELENRKNFVLSRMKTLGYVTEKEYAAATAEKVAFMPQKRAGISAPHFVMYVLDILGEKYGEDIVRRSGFTVITTLDADLQKKAEEVVSKHGKRMEELFNASNAGLVAIDPKTGRILAMVGSRNYFDINNGGNFNVMLSKRQPGSALKPFVYATAFKRGFTPETVVFNVETNFSTVAGKEYKPGNYNGSFSGPVTLRKALGQSLNVPAVKVLYLVGLNNAIKTTEDFGISTLKDPERIGLTLVLGGGEVIPLELTSAYGVFANDGLLAQPHSIIEIKDKLGTVIEKENITSRRVIDKKITATISDILSDNDARLPVFSRRSPLYFPDKDVAVKTGTTNNFRDAWTIGYTPSIVVGAWAGNNDNTQMAKMPASAVVTPMWREFILYALGSLPDEKFQDMPKYDAKKPVLRGIWKGSRTYFTDKISGKIATDFTPESEKKENIIKEVHSILHWVDKSYPDGPIPERPDKDPQYKNWESPVRKWADKMGYSDEDASTITTETDSVHTPDTVPTVTLKNNGELDFPANYESIVFMPDIQSKYGIKEVDVFVDGGFIKSIKGSADEISLSNNVVKLNAGTHIFELKIYDVVGNKTSGKFKFSVSAP